MRNETVSQSQKLLITKRNKNTVTSHWKIFVDTLIKGSLPIMDKHTLYAPGKKL